MQQKIVNTTKIGIIGSGGIGGVVAKLAVKAGYEVIISNSRGPETLRQQVADLGGRSSSATSEQLALQCDIIVIATPLGALQSLPVESLFGKVVIDMMNYYPMRENPMPELDSGKLTSSEYVQNYLKGAKVIKALHNQDAPHLLINARIDAQIDRFTLPIAGDDLDAKKTVTDFINKIGYEVVDTGLLKDSWRIEPSSPVYVVPYAPEIPDTLTGEAAELFYVLTSPDPITKTKAQQLIDSARKPKVIGGFPNDLPSVWTDIVFRWQAVFDKAQQKK